MSNPFYRACLASFILAVVSGMQAQTTQAPSSSTTQTTNPVPATTSTAPAVPPLIQFSGILKDTNGQPITAITGVTFSIYQDQDGGTPLWMETQNVQPDSQGRYTVLLGSNSSQGVPADLFGSGQSRWLAVEGQGLQQTSRVLLVSVPYAMKAADADTLGGMPVSAFVLANPPAGNGSGTTASAGTAATSTTTTGGASTTSTSTTGTTTGSASTKTKTASSQPSGTSPNTNLLVKYDSSGNLVPSAAYESGGYVGIGTSSPVTPLQVNGNILMSGQQTHQVQVWGAATNGRFGQDSQGVFLSGDSQGSSVRFLTNNGALNEWLRINPTGSVNIGTAQAATNGQLVIAPDNADAVHSIIGQAGSQYHLRLSRAVPDNRGATDFLIVPYNYGIAVEYPGVVEFWNQEFSVHNNPTMPFQGAYFWVGDEIDSGGLFVTAMNNGGGTNSWVELAADRFTHTSHGSLNFTVRNPTDAFRFDVGPFGSEVMAGQISGTGTVSSLDLFSGTAQATVRASAGSPGGVAIGATSNTPLSLFANGGSGQVTLFPSGNFSIGNSSDLAPLAVGSQGQFQVSAAGAATIGGGTAITRHLSLTAPLSVPQLAAGSCSAVPVTVTGANDGDSVALGVPDALASTDGLVWAGWVSAADTVSVRFCNVTAQTIPAPASASVRVDVWQH